jgi:MFS family permease
VIESGITVSQVLGAPLAAALLAADGAAGLKGWQWVFLGEAAPAVVLAGVVAAVLPSGVAAARFLSPQQRAALAREIAAAQRRCGGGGGGGSSSGGGWQARHSHDGEAPLAASRTTGGGGAATAPAPHLSVHAVLAAMRSRIVLYAGLW